MPGEQARQLLVAEAIVQRDERHPREGRPEGGDRVREMVGPQVEDGWIPAESVRGSLRESEQASRGQRMPVGRYCRAIAGRGGHLEDHRDVQGSTALFTR